MLASLPAVADPRHQPTITIDVAPAHAHLLCGDERAQESLRFATKDLPKLRRVNALKPDSQQARLARGHQFEGVVVRDAHHLDDELFAKQIATRWRTAVALRAPPSNAAMTAASAFSMRIEICLARALLIRSQHVKPRSLKSHAVRRHHWTRGDY